MRLRARRGKPVTTSSKISSTHAGRVISRSSTQNGRRRGYRARACPYRFDHHGSHIVASCENARYTRDIVRGRSDDIRAATSGSHRRSACRRGAPSRERRMIVPTVEVAHGAHDLPFAARGAQERRIARCVASVPEDVKRALGRRNQLLDETRPFDLQFVAFAAKCMPLRSCVWAASTTLGC